MPMAVPGDAAWGDGVVHVPGKPVYRTGLHDVPVMHGDAPDGSLVPLNLRGGRRHDQVPRLNAFTAAHPDITITPGGVPLAPAWDPAGWWQAAITAGDGTVEFVTRYELSDLLDILEERFPL
jgi:hypothetical protein